MFSFASLSVFTLFAMATAMLGVWLTSLPEVSRRVIPFSGAVLVIVSLVWVLPELVSEFGFGLGAGLMTAGFVVLFVIDRYIYAVCPACSHTHDHDNCHTPLHGFAGPLILAAMLHNLFDGWMLAAGSELGAGSVGQAILLGVGVHKLPEGLAFGVIVRAAMKSRAKALVVAAFTQGMMLAGGLLERAASPYMGNRWVALLLAFGGGTFLYLGYHAMHAEWKRRTSAHKHAGVSLH